MLRVIFMGTPAFAVPTLTQIAAAGHEIAAVYTRPPRAAGRGMGERKSPVHLSAERAGWPVATPHSFRGADDKRAFAAYRADVAVVVAYGLILPKAVLDAPSRGCLNLHASALPRWRGAAPIARAIMAGDSRTAATVMRMDEGLDSGPICATQEIAIGPDMTAGQLHDVLALRGAALMVRALDALQQGKLLCTPQPPGASYAPKIDKAESRIDFTGSAQEVHNRIRGLSPLPGAYFEVAHLGKPERVKVLLAALAEGAGPPGSVLDQSLSIACGVGAVRLLQLQRSGKRPMAAAEFLRGFPLPTGTRL